MSLANFSPIFLYSFSLSLLRTHTIIIKQYLVVMQLESQMEHMWAIFTALINLVIAIQAMSLVAVLMITSSRCNHINICSKETKMPTNASRIFIEAHLKLSRVPRLAQPPLIVKMHSSRTLMALISTHRGWIAWASEELFFQTWNCNSSMLRLIILGNKLEIVYTLRATQSQHSLVMKVRTSGSTAHPSSKLRRVDRIATGRLRIRLLEVLHHIIYSNRKTSTISNSSLVHLMWWLRELTVNKDMASKIDCSLSTWTIKYLQS